MRLAAAVLLVLLVLAAHAAAGEWRIVLVDRLFIGGASGPRGAPIGMTGLAGGRVGVVSAFLNGSTVLTIVNVEGGLRVEAQRSLESGGIPFCAAARGGSLEALVKEGQKIRGYVLAPDGSLTGGLVFTSDKALFPSGCALREGLYVIYGAVLDNETSLDPYVALVRPDGEVARDYVLRLPGMESAIDVAPIEGGVLVVVNNASTRGDIRLYRVDEGGWRLLARLENMTYVGSSRGAGKIAVVASEPGGQRVVLLASEDGLSRAVRFSGAGIVPENAVPLNNGLVLVVGYRANRTSGLRDAVAALVDPETGRVLALNEAYGTRSADLFMAVPVGGSGVVAGGVHGGRPLVAYYLLEEQAGEPNPGTRTAGGTRVLGVAAGTVAAALLLVLIAAWILRRRPGQPPPPGGPGAASRAGGREWRLGGE